MSDNYMECPCCGGIAAQGMVGDGDALLCGCLGQVSYDGESDPWINVSEECPCDREPARDE